LSHTVNAGPKRVGHFVVMEIESMLPARHLVFTASIVALLAALQVQPAYAAFGITSATGVTVSPAPLPSVQPGVSEATLPVIFPEILNGRVTSPAGLRVDH